jgi:LCP family protein required for cell wall assembly
MEPDGTPPDAPTNPAARPVVAGGGAQVSAPEAPQVAAPVPAPVPPPPPAEPPLIAPPAWPPGNEPLPPELSPRGTPKPPRKKRRFGWGKRITALLVVLLLTAFGIFWSWDAGLHRTDALKSYPGRIGNTAGTNWLIVGSDSRADLTEAQKKALATGDAAGSRTDTIMIVHTGSKKTTLLSLPRDTYVPIPGHGRNKLNAAFAFGGASLLVQTVEGVTGLHIDHYAEIGFGGFASMVDAVGGVTLCLSAPLSDGNAGINLPAGCQKLNGAQALGYVRSRKFATGDLERVQHQRQFLSALLSKVASPGTLINPFKSIPLGYDAVDALTVDKGSHIWDVISLGLALRDAGGGKGYTLTVPISGFENVSGVGSVVLWNRTQALELFAALKNDQPIPAALVPKS